MLHFFIGAVSMYYLLRVRLSCSIGWSYFGTVGFTFSSSLVRALYNSQLAAFNCLPILAVVLLGWFQYYSSKTKRRMYGYTFVVLFVLLTYTSWYAACFCGLFGIIYCISFICCSFSYKYNIFQSYKVTRELIFEILSYFVFMMVLFIPFMKIYIPCMLSTSGYSYEMCTEFIPNIIDLINIGPTNIVIGKILNEMELNSLQYGFSLVLLLLFLKFVIYNHKKIIVKAETKAEDMDISTFILRTICVAIIVGLFSIVSLGKRETSIWYLYYNLVPVLSSVRAICRFWIWLCFPICVVTAYLANDFFSQKGEILNIVVGICFSLILLISNLDYKGGPISDSWMHDKQVRFISSVATPPSDLECFYIIDSRKEDKKAYEYQMDAFEIATYYSIKTINGYSGGTPIGFGEIFEVASDNYEPYILNVLVPKYNLNNVYAYDEGTNSWIPSSDRLLLY